MNNPFYIPTRIYRLFSTVLLLAVMWYGISCELVSDSSGAIGSRGNCEIDGFYDTSVLVGTTRLAGTTAPTPEKVSLIELILEEDSLGNKTITESPVSNPQYSLIETDNKFTVYTDKEIENLVVRIYFSDDTYYDSVLPNKPNPASIIYSEPVSENTHYASKVIRKHLMEEEQNVLFFKNFLRFDLAEFWPKPLDGLSDADLKKIEDAIIDLINTITTEAEKTFQEIIQSDPLMESAAEDYQAALQEIEAKKKELEQQMYRSIYENKGNPDKVKEAMDLFHQTMNHLYVDAKIGAVALSWAQFVALEIVDRYLKSLKSTVNTFFVDKIFRKMVNSLRREIYHQQYRDLFLLIDYQIKEIFNLTNQKYENQADPHQGKLYSIAAHDMYEHFYQAIKNLERSLLELKDPVEFQDQLVEIVRAFRINLINLFKGIVRDTTAIGEDSIATPEQIDSFIQETKNTRDQLVLKLKESELAAEPYAEVKKAFSEYATALKEKGDNIFNASSVANDNPKLSQIRFQLINTLIIILIN